MRGGDGLANVEKDIADAILRSEGLTASRLGLRFDRVVNRVLGGLRSRADAIVPEKQAVLVTLSAPIRLPAQTAAAMWGEIEMIVSAGARGAERSAAIHGNSVRVRLAEHASPRTLKLIGFVHNPDAAPDELLALAERWLRNEA
jgi:hypothetical protein